MKKLTLALLLLFGFGALYGMQEAPEQEQMEYECMRNVRAGVKQQLPNTVQQKIVAKDNPQQVIDFLRSTLTCIKILSISPGSFCPRFSQDGKIVAMCRKNGNAGRHIAFYDTQDGEEAWRIDGHDLIMSPEGVMALVGYQDITEGYENRGYDLYNLETRQPVRTFSGRVFTGEGKFSDDGSVVCMAFRNDQPDLKEYHIYDTHSGQELVPNLNYMLSNYDHTRFPVLSSRGTFVVIEREPNVSIYNTRTQQEQILENAAYCDISKDEKKLLVAVDDQIRVYSLETFEPLFEISADNDGGLCGMRFHERDTIISVERSSAQGGFLEFYDIETKEKLFPFNLHDYRYRVDRRWLTLYRNDTDTMGSHYKISKLLKNSQKFSDHPDEALDIVREQKLAERSEGALFWNKLGIYDLETGKQVFNRQHYCLDLNFQAARVLDISSSKCFLHDLRTLQQLGKMPSHLTMSQYELLEGFAQAIKDTLELRRNGTQDQRARIHANEEQWQTFLSFHPEVQDVLKWYIKKAE